MIFTWIAILALVVALFFGVTLFADTGGERMRALSERLNLVDQARRRASSVGLEALHHDLLSEIPWFHRWLTHMLSAQRLGPWLRQAAVDVRPGKFLLISAAAGVGAGWLAVVFVPWLGVAGAVILAAALPWLWVAQRRQKRLAAFQARFPDAIDLLVRATRAGHPPSAALELIATEMPDPVAGEFRQVFEQQRFGLPLRDAMLNLADRVPLVDVRFFATTLILQRETGGNLAEILERLAGLIRERTKILRQVRTHTAQGRMTTWVLVGLAPTLLLAMLIISRPFVMPLFVDPMGQAMLIAGTGLQLIGLVLLRRVVTIKV